MGIPRFLLFFASVIFFLHRGYGCQMEGVSNWLLTQESEVLDTHRGTVLNRITTNIASLTGITVGGSVNYASYLNIQLNGDGYFTISTSDGYASYEENETSEYISFTVNFRCTDASTNSLIFSIRVVDTNNNPPTFRPTDVYEFKITPPLPPGFQITGIFGNDIIVRDIDLTTSRIDFTIQDNPYFEIAYEGQSSTDQKEFIASLRTKDLIRNLSEDVELSITATDVDATGDPPITTTATIRVTADESFLFPEELVFAQPFYVATITNNQLILEEIISLQQGYDDEVTFSLEGEHSNYFGLTRNGNEISIAITSALSNEILRSGRIILVVKAEREYTSGASATIIVELPEVLGLEFEQAQYEGRIMDNELQTLQLTLSHGYEDGFSVNLQNEFASYFSTSIQGNLITLTMDALNPSIINGNNFITLLVIASNDFSTASATVILDIIKDDNVTPLFEKAIYTGKYDSETGLTVEQIMLQQGYDDTVSYFLEGEYSEYFSFTSLGAAVTLTSLDIPPEVWIEQQLLLTIGATKPRAVTATTTVSITLPPARHLSFEELTYSGTLQDDALTLRTIVLNVGYADDVNFTLSGDYSSYFTILPVQNEVTINLSQTPADDIILENNFLTLTLSAAGLHTLPTSTTILLEIIKQDLTTPVFTENIYSGIYLSDNLIEIGNISLAQGYDSSVNFLLDGEHSQYFQVSNVAHELNLALVSDIPPEVIFREKVLLFTILAEKPFTIGANAAVSISFPQELTDTSIMRFSRNNYVGALEDNALTLENIVLESGYEIGTEFSLSGEYSTYFLLQISNNVITIILQNPISAEVLGNNEYIILEVEASRERAISVSSTVIIDIVKQEIVPPIFSNAYYKSVYADGYLEDLTITLLEGYDDTVTFELQGESSIWFSIINLENNIYVTINSSVEIPTSILENNDYFLFTIVANKPDTINAEATIFIHLPKDAQETAILRFSQTSYVGRIENAELYAPTIILLGEREPISFNITGDYAHYFEITQASGFEILIELRDGSLPENLNEIPFIVLDIEALYPEAISGHASVILEVVKEPDIVTPVFEQAYYIGEYSEQGGLQFEQSMRLSQGFDQTVMFTLAGDEAEWFELNSTAQNNLTLAVTNSELQLIKDRSYVVLSVVATKPGSISAESAIIVNLSDLLVTVPMRFSQNFYMGSIQNNTVNIANINLEEGYSAGINITFTGDHVEYFQLTVEDNNFTLTLLSELPETEKNLNVFVFTLEVDNEGTRAHTTIVLENIKSEVARLAFEEAYYVGSYSITSGFIFDPQITLIDGYDDTVLFALEGENSQWFGIIENQYPLILTQVDPIPNEVVSNNEQLIFVVRAEKPGNITARSTVIISVVNDITVLSFERNVYLGTVENNSTSIDAVLLTEGYSENVTFTLFGDLESYFSLIQEGNSVIVSLQTTIPVELLPNNGVILLELEASATEAISAFTTLVFGIIRNESVPLQFSEVYYTGRYKGSGVLEIQNTIRLVTGYDETTRFVLEGDDSRYFQAVGINDTVSLVLVSEIPTEVVLNYHQLIFTIRADKSDFISARATIVIALINESETTVLQFEQNAYLGSIENNTINLSSITLNEGYRENVTFTLIGDLKRYFSLTTANATIVISLDTAIPNNLIPANGIILLELQATAPNSISAYTTIVLSHEVDTDLKVLEFSNNYYIGQYSEAEGLIFDSNITLTEVYDETVNFTLEGEDSQYFEIDTRGNTISLILNNPIPDEVVTNNQQLIFTVRAEKHETISARATIIISLLKDFPYTAILRFDQISYLGFLENEMLTFESITLNDANVENITYVLDGALSNYFIISTTQESVMISLTSQIPEELLPESKLIILELQATASEAISAYTALIIQIVQQNESAVLGQLIFNQAYYTGLYSESDGFTFTDLITLVEGYDDNVTFFLEGADSQYFETVRESENFVSLRLISAIPSAVVLNTHHLIFTIQAEKPDGISGRATIVIALLDEHNEGILGFDRVTYLGSIEDGTIEIEPITLVEGYSETVSFRLYGDLQNYFNITSEGTTVTINVQTVIPEHLLPENQIIILELEAFSPESRSAFAVLIIHVIQEETAVFEQLVFSEAYYTGLYSEADGLHFENIITLAQGYDPNVTFVLEGDSAQYFEAVVIDNSVSLRLTTPIPSAVAMNNQQLIFTIRADKPDALSARATIVISLLDEYNEDVNLLGFDRITYTGSIENGTLNLDPISLSEGYSSDVSFRLFGDLASYFILTSEEETVKLSLDNNISEEFPSDNFIVLLELEATAPNTLSAHAAIVLEVIQEQRIPNLEQLVFREAYYTGHYTEIDGLTFEDNITLAEGYNENVTFILEGDSSQYFEAVVSGNSVSLILITPITSAVVMNNQQLIFTIRAQSTVAIFARATIVISLLDEYNENVNLIGFDRISYTGSIENGTLDLDPISLSEGYSSDVSFRLFGDLASYFILTSEEETVKLSLDNNISEEFLRVNSIVLLELEAIAPNTLSAHAAIVLEVIQEQRNLEQLVFREAYYTGHYTEKDGLTFEDNITLAEGYNENVTFTLEGESSQYFEAVVSGNSVSLILITPITSAVVMNNQQIIFTIRAQSSETTPARATIVISLLDEYKDNMMILGFDQITYVGSINNNTFNLEPVTLSEGYSENVTFRLFGDLNSYFTVSQQESRLIIALNAEIPEDVIPDNRIIILELKASAPNSLSARAVILIEVIQEESSLLERLIFSETYYLGSYIEVDGLKFEDNITLAEGYDEDVTFSLVGETSIYFETFVVAENTVSLRLTMPIPPAVVINNHQLIFTINANKPNAISAAAAIIISLKDEYIETTPVLGFSRINYIGSIKEDVVDIESIILSEGYSNSVEITLHGDLQHYFTLTANQASILISLSSAIPEEFLPSNRIIILELQASSPDVIISAFATVVLEIVEDVIEMTFSYPYYTGQYLAEDRLEFNESIFLSQGYDESVQFALDGDHSQWFQISVSGNSVSLSLNTMIPDYVFETNRKLIFIVTAQNSRSSTRATIIISLINESTGSNVEQFGKVLYQGFVQGDEVYHEIIGLSDYNGTNVQVLGEYAGLFSTSFTDGVVTVRGSGSITLPDDVLYAALELQAGTAGAVLLLDIIHTENPEPPSVTFSSSSYVLTTDVSQIGLLGRVQATADNGEAVTYSLVVDDGHLLQRISISEDGELHLSSPANVGIYSFQVIATTVYTRASATAVVHLRVEAITILDEDYVLPPLQILDRDEESPYENLIPFNSTEYVGCRFILNNCWPSDQSWLYVNENGLHTTAIDREHASIAFMALSQVQIELILECDSDNESIRQKRSMNSELKTNQLEHLGPYDYGNSKWIITDSINHNPRRSYVNLIVNDINDNYPIFDGKQDEPIVVGYPVAELEERVLPRALAEVKATDADVGENAALVYWSSEEILAVSPSTGFVHVRDISRLENGTTLTVHATDRNGQGLTGSLDLLVKLIDTSHIAVITIRDAFLADEYQILNNLTAVVGYEVKALRASVISDSESEEANSRRKREAIISSGATLQLYVYGLIEREPVHVERLTEDINTNVIEAVVIASTVSLKDHLESLEICSMPERDTGLFVSTIVLAVLLFILIVTAAVWFFLKWRKNQNYEEFTDENSLSSQNDLVPASNVLKPEEPKPRMNIDDLKRSEKRLQEMLDAPNSASLSQPTSQTVENLAESKVNMSDLPLVIQSIDKLKDCDETDDEDEFGERKKITPKRKSVVTFNENVEKIIHVEDPPEDSEVEVYKL